MFCYLRTAGLKDSALYIHIPFCDHKCIYCDFYSVITKDNILNFLQAVKKEIEYYTRFYNDEHIFTSIYFGGGTPSLMEPSYIREIIYLLKNSYAISADAEITLETNPGTVNKEKLTNFRKIGINRLSIGIQSFHNDELKFLTRIHDKETAVKTVYNAYEAGFENINVDLIFNIPGQTKEKWEYNLKQAVNLPVKHISAYSLILERGTILNKMVLDGKVVLQDDDYDADLYELTIDLLLSNGFIQYEVSNFTKPGYECRHNNAYWRYRDYLSFGPSAHSFVNKKRWRNYSSLKHYISEIENNGFAAASSEIINEDTALNDYVMLALRSKGIDLNELGKKFGSAWIKRNINYIETLVNKNLAVSEDNFVHLTRTGFAVCDEILSKFI